MTIYEILPLPCKTEWEGRKERKIGKKQTRQDSYDEADITRHTEKSIMSRTKNRTAISTDVIGQKGPLFVVADENDNSFYGWS